LPEGIVLWGVRNIYYVLDNESKKEFKCLLKGKVLETDFNVKGRRETNPVVVGDEVIFNILDNENGHIIGRKKRRNEFKRLKGGGRVVQTIFANVDCLLIVDSVSNPPLRPFFIDRCILTAEYTGIEAVIVFNKIDLLDDENKEFYEKTKSIYSSLGYKIFETSVFDALGIESLKEFIGGKICSFQGRSGVGKSSLIKKIDPRYADIKIGEVNKKYDRGVHTTTFAKIYPFENNAKIIDTPGVRELSIYIDKPEYVENYFKDFDGYRDRCRFNGCQHMDEPDCAVKRALGEGKIDEQRYESYLRIRETVDKFDDSVIT
jgi:ribosome biogenesis GTPase / thiamine phosphate phosphatase